MGDFRISGIASGMDTETMIKDLMRAERDRRVTKLGQTKQIDTWKQELYQELNKDMANFIMDTRKEFGISNVSSYGDFDSDDFNWVKNASSSDETVATATASSQSVNGIYNVHVTSLAENFTIASGSDLGDLTNLKDQFSLDADAVIEFTIESKDGISKTFRYSDRTDLKDINGDPLALDGDIASTTLVDMVKDINNYSQPDPDNPLGMKDLGVTAVYDPNINRFFLQTKESGEDNGFKIYQGPDPESGEVSQANVNFIAGAGNILDLNWPVEPSEYIDVNGFYQGKNGSIDFEGANDISISSNQYTINGIGFDFKKAGSDFTVQVGNNVDDVVDKVTSFVEKYNEIIDKIGKEMSEKTYRDFKPLSAEEKEGMSDNEVELWEGKAKSGLLKNDEILTRSMQTIRTGWYTNIEGTTGTYNHLTQIGITTESYSSGTVGGKLKIDESKLREAIEKDPDSVMEVLFKEPSDEFNNTSESNLSSSQITQKRSESGLMRRLYDNMVSGMQDVINKSGYGDDSTLLKNVQGNILREFTISQSSISRIDQGLLDLNKRIDQQENLLSSIEDRYWKKFTAMETALSKINQQSDWLTSQLG